MRPEDMAYPSTKEMECDANDGYGSMGLTKRELFAAMAMQGMAMRTTILLDSELAFHSVQLADALIAALSKEPKP